VRYHMFTTMKMTIFLLGCDAVLPSRQIPRFRRNILSPSSAFKMQTDVSPKRLCLPASLHGLRTRNNIVCSKIADNKNLIFVRERLSLRNLEKTYSRLCFGKFWNIIVLPTEIASNIVTFIEYTDQILNSVAVIKWRDHKCRTTQFGRVPLYGATALGGARLAVA
jgi:hypothetical protein